MSPSEALTIKPEEVAARLADPNTEACPLLRLVAANLIRESILREQLRLLEEQSKQQGA